MKPTPILLLRRVLLPVILIAFIAAGILYGLSTPFLDVSDEVRHYAMVEQLAQGKGLPVQNPSQHGFYEQEGSQPPLYYALMALVARPFSRSDFMHLAQFNPHARLGRADTTSNWNQLIHTPAENYPWHGTVLVVQLIRLFGVLMGAASVACTYLVARELAPNRSWAPYAALSAAGFTAFTPMFVFISASVNNDTLAAMLSSIAILTGIHIIKQRLTWRYAALLGLLLAADALTKSSALALVIVLPLAIWVSEWLRVGKREGLGLLRPIPKLALTGILVATIAGWWYVRNAILYNGDLTGTDMMATIAGARQQLPSLGELLSEWGGFREAYWGLFGAVNIPMSQWIYHVFDALLIVAGMGLLLRVGDLIRLLRGARRPPTDVAEPQPNSSGDSTRLRQAIRERLLPALACLGVFVVAFIALVHWTSITLASQGRLLFPVIAILSSFIALGLYRLVDSLTTFRTYVTPIVRFGAHTVLAGITVFMLCLTFACPFVFIRPAYAKPVVYAADTPLPAGIRQTELRYGDAILWVGYSVDTPRVRPGDEFGLTLYWKALRSMHTNYSAFIRLYGRTDKELYLLDTYPGGGMYQTSLWQPGQLIADHYRLRIADTVTLEQQLPTALLLDVGFWNLQTRQFMPTSKPDGTPTGRQRYEVGALAWPGASPSLHYPALSLAQVQQTQTSQVGNTLTFTITWVATADFTEDYTVFVHLLNSEGQKVAQADGRAADNHFSSLWWRKGDVVVDPHTLLLPKNLPKGEYMINFGLYIPADGSRMPAFDAQGQVIGDATLSIPVTIR